MSRDYTRCPFSIGLFLGTTVLATCFIRNERLGRSLTSKATASSTSTSSSASSALTMKLPRCQVVFVVGGPGAGKGTQCQLLEQRLKTTKEEDGTVVTGRWKHLSAGDLLRAERAAGGELGDLINQKISAGQIVPSTITCKLLENAMAAEYTASCSKDVKSGNVPTTNFLIDGYPRSIENIQAWEETMAPYHTLKFLLNFECPEEVLVGRLLERGQSSGRVDDTIDVIRKRFQTFQKESLPIIGYYEALGVPVHKIASDQSVEQVYAKVAALF